jgi:hypothetical protein
MGTNASEVPLEPDPSERRRWPRKEGLLSGVVADVNGEISFDCTILDMNPQGAQIAFSDKLPLGEQIYLLDISNLTAYLASVAWNNSDRAGLSFVQSCAIGLALPPGLKFLWRLFLEAKLRELDRVVAKGVPVGLAFRTIGLSDADLDQMARHAGTDKKFERLLLLAKRLMNGSPRSE